MKNRKAAMLLWASHVFYCLFLPVWFIFFGLSMRMFDDPKLEGNILAIVLKYVIGAYPFVVIAVIVVTWLSYQKEIWKKMILVNALPIVWIGPILLLFLFANFI
ncbi:hypothetical protein [Jeotgalibacillus marinus]|uniref:Uncharacterized protein n=1 Tax=Jeotgalibacillus marinus TaxID=86667 RepID=A0ABV3Q1J0_9BACL